MFPYSIYFFVCLFIKFNPFISKTRIKKNVLAENDLISIKFKDVPSTLKQHDSKEGKTPVKTTQFLYFITVS